MMSLEGLRTKISGYIASIIPITGVMGYQLDPNMIIELLSNYGVPLACAQFLTSIGVHHFRNKAELPAPAIVKEKPVIEPKVIEEPAQPQLSNLEQEILDLSNGKFEDD